MAVELFTKNDLFEKENVFGARLIMDEDSSAIAALRIASPHDIIKWSDTNHVTKGFKGALLTMKLKKELVDYFYSCFTAAIEDNKGNKSGLESALKSIVPHAFGDHSQCTFHDNNGNYDYKYIPGKKPLNSKELKTTMESLMSRYIQNADRLAPGASTQANESWNNTVASFCPKSKHYSGSDSLNFRVGAAVCQKNLGYQYINNVYRKILISPSSKSQKYRKIRENKMKKKVLFQKTIESMKKRKENKRKRTSKDNSNERREGITYQSNMGFTVTDVGEDIASETLIEIDSSDETVKNYRIVYFDIETTGLRVSDQICQVLLFTKYKFLFCM